MARIVDASGGREKVRLLPREAEQQT